MSLRERLSNLAELYYMDNGDDGFDLHERLAIAAARMALEEALQECRPPNAWDQEDCATELRSLRDGLE